MEGLSAQQFVTCFVFLFTLSTPSSAAIGSLAARVGQALARCDPATAARMGVQRSFAHSICALGVRRVLAKHDVLVSALFAQCCGRAADGMEATHRRRREVANVADVITLLRDLQLDSPHDCEAAVTSLSHVLTSGDVISPLVFDLVNDPVAVMREEAVKVSPLSLRVSNEEIDIVSDQALPALIANVPAVDSTCQDDVAASSVGQGSGAMLGRRTS